MSGFDAAAVTNLVKSLNSHVGEGLSTSGGSLHVDSLALESDGTVRGGIAELTAKGHAEQDGTPTPDNPVSIQVVRGRNLLDASAMIDGHQVSASNGTLINEQVDFHYLDYLELNADSQYVLSVIQGTVANPVRLICYDADKQFISALVSTSPSIGANYVGVFTMPSNAKYVRLSFRKDCTSPQLTLGSTSQPYVPYGHVGMEVRDSEDNLLSTTPIPLPQRGWVAGLPDGTADSLRLDGAGKCEWTLPTKIQDLGDIPASDFQSVSGSQFSMAIEDAKRKAMQSQSLVRDDYYCTHFHFRAERTSAGDSILYDPSSNLIPRFYAVFGDDVTSTTSAKQWLTDNNVALLYPLATPVTEDCGYVEDWSTDLPEGAVITIPELDALNIKYFIGSDVTELAKQWYERTNDTDIAQVEDAVADLASDVIEHTPYYFGTDKVGNRTMIAIFRRGGLA